MVDPAEKVVAVLGASAPNGIGWACVRRFIKDGMKVVAGARSYERLSRMCEEIGAHPVRCDAASRGDIAGFADAVLDEYGRIDIAVNSAGSGQLSTVADVTEEMLRESMVTNYFGMVNFVQIMAAAMGERTADRIGSIVLVSTLSVDHPMPGVFPYAAAKGATDTLVRYAALEFGPRNIKVNSINPGLVMTDLARSGGLDGLEMVAELSAQAAALRRIATADECADGVHWLSTSGFVSGVHLKICGGAHLRPQFG